MQVRVLAALAVGALLISGFGYIWVNSGSNPAETLPIPRFSNPAASVDPSTAQPRATLLPTDCADVLSGRADMAALLGKPTGSVGVHTVLGVPSPQVGQLERLTCSYRMPGGGDQAVVLTLGAFTDPTAASVQRRRNLAAEQSGAQSAKPVSLGSAEATLVTEPNQKVLLIAHDRYTLTAGMADGVVADQQTEPVLTDLAQRVLPSLSSNPNRR